MTLAPTELIDHTSLVKPPLVRYIRPHGVQHSTHLGGGTREPVSRQGKSRWQGRQARRCRTTQIGLPCSDDPPPQPPMRTRRTTTFVATWVDMRTRNRRASHNTRHHDVSASRVRPGQVEEAVHTHSHRDGTAPPWRCTIGRPRQAWHVSPLPAPVPRHPQAVPQGNECPYRRCDPLGTHGRELHSTIGLDTCCRRLALACKRRGMCTRSGRHQDRGKGMCTQLRDVVSPTCGAVQVTWKQGEWIKISTKRTDAVLVHRTTSFHRATAPPTIAMDACGPTETRRGCACSTVLWWH